MNKLTFYVPCADSCIGPTKAKFRCPAVAINCHTRQIYGPFPSNADANAWVEKTDPQGTWDFEDLIPPEAVTAVSGADTNPNSAEGSSHGSATATGADSAGLGPYAKARMMLGREDISDDLYEALQSARAEIMWWVHEHGCCEGHEEKALAIIDAALAKAEDE